jgi:hypothetical protein
MLPTRSPIPHGRPPLRPDRAIQRKSLRASRSINNHILASLAQLEWNGQSPSSDNPRRRPDSRATLHITDRNRDDGITIIDSRPTTDFEWHLDPHRPGRAVACASYSGRMLNVGSLCPCFLAFSHYLAITPKTLEDELPPRQRCIEFGHPCTSVGDVSLPPHPSGASIPRTLWPRGLVQGCPPCNVPGAGPRSELSRHLESWSSRPDPTGAGALPHRSIQF